MRRTVQKLRERPKEERVAVAGSIAIGVVALLLVGWVAFFLHDLGSGGPVRAEVPEAASMQGQSTIAPPPTTLEFDTPAPATSSLDPQ